MINLFFAESILPFARKTGGSNMQQDTIDAVGTFVKKYGVWIIAGLMILEIALARKRGEL